MSGHQKRLSLGIALYHIDPTSIKGLTAYAFNLLAGFKSADQSNHYLLLVRPEHVKYFKDLPLNFTVQILTAFKTNRLSRKLAQLLQTYIFSLPPLTKFYAKVDKILNTQLIKELDRLNLDVLYIPSGTTYPLGLKTPVVISLHDIQYAHLPQFFTFWQRRSREAGHRASVKQARYVQASSEFVRQDFIHFFGCDPTKVVLIRDGISPEFKQAISEAIKKAVSQKYSLPPKFVFYPAQHWPHKNHLTLFRALREIGRKGQKISLVLTGTERAGKENLKIITTELGISDQITLGNVPFNDLVALYQMATLLCVPTLHESNSLPILEALASGTPVVASNIEPNVELNTNGAITIFDQLDPGDLAEKLELLYNNSSLQEEKRRLGYELAARYSWENTAKEYLKLFQYVHK